jgi:hypothetical protein
MLGLAPQEGPPDDPDGKLEPLGWRFNVEPRGVWETVERKRAVVPWKHCFCGFLTIIVYTLRGITSEEEEREE